MELIGIIAVIIVIAYLFKVAKVQNEMIDKQDFFSNVLFDLSEMPMEQASAMLPISQISAAQLCSKKGMKEVWYEKDNACYEWMDGERYILINKMSDEKITLAFMDSLQDATNALVWAKMRTI